MTFTLEMATRALEIELRDETEYLQRYDTMLEVVHDNYDVRGGLLSKLIGSAQPCPDSVGIRQITSTHEG
ncbi:hypothetical protein [Pseudomonas capeferrum]